MRFVGTLSAANGHCQIAGQRWLLAKPVMRALLGVACVCAVSSAAHAIEVHYRCDDGVGLRATFETPAGQLGTARLSFDAGGAPLDLPQQMAADGGRYAAGKAEFWIKGERASFTRNGSATVCVAKP